MIANFSADSTQGCELLELSLNNLSVGAISYLWEVYDEFGSLVSSSTLTNPSFFLTEPGSYTVSLTVYDALGLDLNLTIDDFAFVYTNPIADFGSSDVAACPGTLFTFTDDSDPGSFGSLDEYYWVITGGPTLPLATSIDYVFEAPGSYTVYLFITDGAGCSDYETQLITIYDSVHAEFEGDVTVSCTTPLTVDFTNFSTGSGSLSYQWNFGDGGTSTALNPTHIYTTFGSYDVSLIVTNSDGCSDTMTLPDYIEISPTATVDFEATPMSVCLGEIVTFNNLSALTSGTWEWDFGDGITSDLFETSHTYTAAGVYNVSLSGDFGGGCAGSVAYPDLITVEEIPTVTFTATDSVAVCQLPFTVTFNPTITGGSVSYLWEFEDDGFTATSTSSNPTYTWTELGSYDVSVTVTNASGCSATYSVPGYISIGDLVVTPIAAPSSGCIPLGVLFSASAGEPLVTYEWDFGDGGTSTVSNPGHIYNTIGCFTVTIIATSVSGCADTVSIPEFVCAGDTGTAQLFIEDTVCPAAELEVYFLPLDSITADIDAGSDFSIVTTVDSITTINLPSGDHDIDFITWSYGCPDTFSTHVYVIEILDSLMQVDYTCDEPYTVQIFIDTAVANTSCGWEWDFGDGTTDTVSENPIHTYAEPGTYNVSITYSCITTNECSGTGLNVNIQIPFAQFIPDPPFVCDTPAVINFMNTSTDYINDNLSYEWDFGDGDPIVTSTNPTHTFTGYGTYYVTLTVTDDRGCVDDFTDTIGVNAIDASFTLADEGGCVPYIAVLSDSSISEFGTINTWVIDWNDGIVDTFYNAADVTALEHTYFSNGNFIITLTAFDEFGCSDAFADTIKAGAPVADFLVDDSIPCVGQLVYFTELASGLSIDYEWNFGDGSVSSADEPGHVYADAGDFTVTLIVTDILGCTDTMVKPAYIQPDTVVVDYTADVIVASCNYALVQFNSVVADSICEYFWDFGDGGISVDPNPIYPYLEAGSYSVSLTVTDCNGCSSTIVHNGYILVPGPYGFISFSEDTLCVDEAFEIYLNIASTDTLTLYLDNGDVINLDIDYSDSLQTIIIPYTFTTSGVFFPNALLVDTSSCLNIISGSDSIWVGNNPDAAYLVTDSVQCLGTPFTFADSSESLDPIVLWSWNLGDALILLDSSSTYTHTYADTGIYNTALYIYTEYGCSDSMFIDVNVLQYPEISLPEDTAICPGQSVMLDATGGSIFIWTPSAGLSDTSIANPIASPDSTTLYTLDVGNGYCYSTDSVLVTIVNDLILFAGPDTSMCIGDEVQLYSEFITEVSLNNIDFYWTPPDFLDDPFSVAPISSSLDDITYTLYASCGLLNDTANAIIRISNPPDLEIPQDTVLMIEGQVVQLTSEVTGGEGVLIYAWEPVNQVDCPGCEFVYVSPGSNTIYSCEVTDEYGCSDIDFVLVRVLSCDESLFFIPNIITPNGDGRNDVFRFTFEGGIISVDNLNIYSRWGELLFHTDDMDEHWDGTYNGAICNPGVYIYTFNAICLDGSETIVAGNITLVK
ncbi:MAG: PKD domain-containing protein [Fimbriimonadaceae bacterium]|nr:PKD domain-containing protein [Chitinophagales bacterium]